MTEARSKLGIHSNGSRNTGLKDMLNRINNAGRRIALVDSHDDYSAAFDAHQTWPDALTIGDLTEFESQFNIELLRKKAAANPWVKYWQVYNEINGDWVGQADRLIRIMQLYDNEFKFVIFNCSSGTPQYPEIDPVPYREVARACKVAKAGGHLLGLHEYGAIDHHDLIFRYRRLADYLKSQDALCNIVITEAGPDEGSFIGVDKFVAWAKAYDAGLMQDGYILGCALWTLGGGGWQAVNFETALPKLGEYIATVNGPTPPPPPPVKIVKFSGTCPEPRFDAVASAAVAAGATIERVL